MKITLLASDEATAPLYRVRALARLLQRRFEVEVLGFVSEARAIDAAAPRDFPYRAIPVGRGRAFAASARRLREAISGDLVYAMKPRPTSYGVALAHRAATGCPVVVDVDDWEIFMIHPWSRFTLKNMAYALRRLDDPNNHLATWALDRRIGKADGVTAVSRFFQRRYGGLLAPHYVDTALYDPARHDGEASRRALGLEGQRVVVFAGIAHPGKGVAAILEALRGLGPGAPAWRLVIVGPATPYARAIASSDPRVVLVGTQPPTRTPAYLAMADLVVLPQRRSPVAVGQMPMKLFEAMAMAVPVIATALSDIPEVLEGCGRVVPPDDPRALRDAIAELFAEPAAARALGQRARARVVARHSWEVGAAVIGDYLATRASG
ncbi:MAG: glycosyltransferase family 4 protein [Candidatus Sericytochromatia bacterium]|nr:glycosyltransferase family 4 protein [Candidatus Sericytochromatia bacterium]